MLLLVGYQLWRRICQMSQIHRICYCFANFLLEYFVFNHTALTPDVFSIKALHWVPQHFQNSYVLATQQSVATCLCNNQVVLGGKHVFWVSGCQTIYALGSLSCFNGRHATLSNGLRPRFVLMKYRCIPGLHLLLICTHKLPVYISL